MTILERDLRLDPFSLICDKARPIRSLLPVSLAAARPQACFGQSNYPTQTITELLETFRQCRCVFAERSFRIAFVKTRHAVLLSANPFAITPKSSVPMNLRLTDSGHRLAAIACLALPFAFSGCANMVESRTIAAFSEALQEEDVDSLRDVTSSRFEEKSLRHEDSVKDFSVLRIPKGDVEIVDVDHISDTEKRVTGQIGKSKSRRLRYLLVRDEKTGKWVVDDVYIKKQKNGVESTRAVTELMDLVTTVREFIDAWDTGSRSSILRMADPEFGTLLGSLPDEYLMRLAKQTIGDRADSKIRPEAQMDEDVALVRLPGKSGQMIISFTKIRDQWLISDLAVESRKDKDHISSVKQMATVLRSASVFLDSYSVGDKKKLKTVTMKTFFENSLEPAILSTVQLPTASQAASTYQVKLQSGFADFMVATENDLVKLSLSKVEGEDSTTAAQYLIDDVTIYEIDGNQEKRLSAMFLSHAMVELYAEALSLRELQTVQMMSTPEFKQRVWDRVDERLMMQLPMPEIENASPKILTTVFMGAVTEVTVRQGSRALVYVLQDHEGELLVKDVLLPVSGRPNSLCKTLETMVPVVQFANALSAQSIDDLRQLSSRDLNRKVWHRAKQLPSIGLKPHEHFAVPLMSLDMNDDLALVGLGDDQYGAKVRLVREGERFVVDDVKMIAGSEIRQRIDLKEAMQFELSRFRGQASTQQ
ncbi:MAG: hypothetical protein ACI8P0_006667 [Planctomycetaceae bacterium]